MPLAYLTVWELTKSTGAALLSTAFIVFGKLSHTIHVVVFCDYFPVYLLWTAIIIFITFYSCIFFTPIFFGYTPCPLFISNYSVSLVGCPPFIDYEFGAYSVVDLGEEPAPPYFG